MAPAVVPASYGGMFLLFDVRTLCLAREVLVYEAGLADFAHSMQGLGTGPVTPFSSSVAKVLRKG
jgi:acyl-CoA dehydrogenase